MLDLNLRLYGRDTLVLSQLRSRPATRKTPVIVLTAKGDEDNEVQVFELGADDFPHQTLPSQGAFETAGGGLARRKKKDLRLKIED